MLDNNVMESIRTEFQTSIQNALTFNPGSGNIQEAKVVQEFVDSAEFYPCVVIDVQTSESPSRFVGSSKSNTLHFDIYFLTLRPTTSSQIIACSDNTYKSGRQLAEYLAVKVYNYLLSSYHPSFSFIDKIPNLVLKPDFQERDGVFKTLVQLRILV